MVIKQINKPVRYDSNRRRLQQGERQRADGTYDFRWTDRSGTRHSVHARTLTELREKRREIGTIPVKGSGRKETLNDWARKFFALKKDTIRDNTWENYRYSYQHYVEPNFGRNFIQNIKKSDIRMFYLGLCKEKNIRKSIDSIQTVLYQVFQLAVDDDVIQKNPAIGVTKELHRMFTETKKEAMTKKQEKGFFAYLKENEPEWYPIFYILVSTGLRISEMAPLRWEDIDFDSHFISMNHTLMYSKHDDGNGMYVTIRPYGKTAFAIREIPMSEELEKFLREYKKTNKPSSLVIDGYTGFIFTNRFGNLFMETTTNKALKRAVVRYNDYVMRDEDYDPELIVPYITIHQLRHTFLTRMAECNCSMPVLSKIAGHSGDVVLKEVYISVDKDFKQKEMQKYNEYMSQED